jgi:hypothetical protein
LPTGCSPPTTGPWPLPFCDTNEEDLIAEVKGRRLFELDTQRLKSITAMVAVLHGPSLDDGVCMEIGYAAALGVPVIAATTDFQTYGPDPDGERRMPFPEPFLPALVHSVARRHRLGAAPAPDTDVHADPYAEFLTRNLAALDMLLDDVVGELDDPPAQTQPARTPSTGRMVAYLEPSPHADGGLEEAGQALREAGWDVHTATRFKGSDIPGEAHADWAALSRSTVAVVDVRGPETPTGAALAIGACAATDRPVYTPHPGNWWTFADGREPNFRNLMIQYGLTGTYRQPAQLLDLLTVR